MERAVSQTVSERRPPGLSDSWWTGYDIQIRSHRDCRRHRAALPLRAAVCTELHALSAVHFSDLHLSHIVQIAVLCRLNLKSQEPQDKSCFLPSAATFVSVQTSLWGGGLRWWWEETCTASGPAAGTSRHIRSSRGEFSVWRITCVALMSD